MIPVAVELLAGGRRYTLGARPWLMGVLNANPDSFSDAGPRRTSDEQVALAAELVRAGAEILDVGGESAITGRAPTPAEQEIELVVGLIERVVRELGAIVSVDTYKLEVAEAAIAAGASLVNDVSGLRDPRMAALCARTGAALVLMHTRTAPKQRLTDPGYYIDVRADVAGFLRERIETALGQGIAREQLIVDPGPDFAKTPAQTVAVLSELGTLHGLGRPVLLAVSRKDFIGALTRRTPRRRLAGTLAALAHGVDQGAQLLRVHDVAEAADFLAVRAALRGERPVAEDLSLPDDLRWEAPQG